MSTRETERYRVLLQRAYHLDVIDLTWRNSLYAKNVIAHVETSTGGYALKRFRGTWKEAHRLFKRQRYLASFQLAPAWYRTTTGDVLCEMNHGIYYLTDWQSGRPFESTPSDCKLLGETMGRLHRIPILNEHFTAPRSLVQRLLPVKQTLRLLRDKSIPQSVPSTYQAFLKRYGPHIQNDIEIALTTLTTARGLTTCITHGDITVPNVIVGANEVRLIDWERVSLGYAMDELAKTMVNTCMFSSDACDAMLEGYPLSLIEDEDWATLCAFVRIPREIVYLVLRASKRRVDAADEQLWNIVVDTFADRNHWISHLLQARPPTNG